MSKRKTDHADDEQPMLFAELDDSAEHKSMLRLAKKLYAIRAERKEALTESKAREDKAQSELVGLLHEAKMTAFRHKTVRVEIVPRSEKVKVKVDAPVEEDEDADEGDEAKRRKRAAKAEAASDAAAEAPAPRRKKSDAAEIGEPASMKIPQAASA